MSRAHDRELSRDIAIKELLSRGHVSEVRFLREALITARLEHPGIVPVYEAGRWRDGTPFYAMKLVSGRSLRDLIAERATVDERIGLLHHVIAVADAIAYAHDRNIIHRDIKPANVIVGDFGETIVIDWGLAKDISAVEDSAGGVSPFRANRDDDLTAAGSVLGTPAYMAPEQERGEPVDQRADVFAIGAMLWELCALQKVPPTEPTHRHRILRAAGIDRDLATILDKSLHPDPKRRYPHAGALAADLKAFKSGARIGARNYSLPALFSLWVRRHRTLALSALAILVFVAVGSAFYVHNIATERDRADAARMEAEVQRRTADQRRSELVLQHSELLLRSDPTAAVAALAGYDGPDDVRRRRLLAEAKGRGVASAVLRPHSDTIWFLVGEDDGSIVSLGEDRKIRRTTGAQVTTLADDAATSVLCVYSAASRSLAYSTSPPGIAVLDLATLKTTRIVSSKPKAMAISPDGTLVSAVDKNGKINVWALGSGAAVWMEADPDAVDVKFTTLNHLIINERKAIKYVSFDTPLRRSYAASDSVRSLDAHEDEVLFGDDSGSVTLLSPALEVIARRSLCHRQIYSVRFVGNGNLAAFACQDGFVGMINIDRRARAMTEFSVFATSGAAYKVAPDSSGRWVVASGDSNVTYVFDVVAHMLHRYEGQLARISAIAPPTPRFESILAGDLNGTVRVWPLPQREGRTLIDNSTAIFDLVFTPDSQNLIVGGYDRLVRRIRIADGNITEFRGHTGMVTRVLVSPDGKLVASYGTDQTVRSWSLVTGAPIRTFLGHGSEISSADFVDNGWVLSAGADGRLFSWGPLETDVNLLFRNSSPLVALKVLGDRRAVVASKAGNVWDVASVDSARLVRRANGSPVTLIRASLDNRLVATATDSGRVDVYSTTNWKTLLTLDVSGGVRQLVFDPRVRDLAIASDDGHVRIVALDSRRELPWREVSAAVRNITYSPDGGIVAFVCADGGVWLYSVRYDVWVYAQDHFADTIVGEFSPDGKWFASCDRRGGVTLRDVVATFATSTRVTDINRSSL